MRRGMSILLALALVGGAMAAMPAQAKKKAKPVPVTLFAHGNAPVGEAEIPDGVGGIFMPMDTTEPGSGPPKSMGVTNLVATPNTNCAGNPFFAVWVGEVTGTIKGDMKFTFDVLSMPGQVEVRVWPDITTLTCNENFVEPSGAVVVDLPPGGGKVEAVMKGVNFQAQGKLMVQVSPVQPSATQARVLYDSADFPTALEFTCTPASGTSCTP